MEFPWTKINCQYAFVVDFGQHKQWLQSLTTRVCDTLHRMNDRSQAPTRLRRQGLIRGCCPLSRDSRSNVGQIPESKTTITPCQSVQSRLANQMDEPVGHKD